jgi:glycosyltransferase involved in cell wall biosynthesis
VSANTARYNPFVRQFIPNGVDRTIFYPVAGAKTPEPSILFVGTLDGRKRGVLLIKWFTENIRPRFPNASLHMVSPPGKAGAGVNYHTDISGAEIAELYRRCWIYASPSLYEGFGLPYLEAMASATPVVATPNPGSREVLGGGRYGVLADDAAFPEAVLNLLGDAAKREALVPPGLERAAEYDVTSMIDAYEARLYRMARSRHE